MKYWIRYITVALSLIITHLSFSCGMSLSDIETFSLFINPIQESDFLFQYQFEPYTFTYGNPYYEDDENDPSKNILEWARILKAESKTDEVSNLVYGNHLLDLIKLHKGKKKKLPISDIKTSSNISLYKTLYNDEDLLTYVYLIQDYSYRSSRFTDEWNYAYHVGKADDDKLNENQKLSINLYNKLTARKDRLSVFLKERLAYHLVRSAYFNKDYELANSYFKTYAKPNQKPFKSSIIQEWLMGLEAGLEARFGDPNKAFVLYAKRFNRGSESHFQTYIDLNWLGDDIDLQSALKHSRNDQEKIDVLVGYSAVQHDASTEAFYNELLELKDERILRFIWTRELQKIEFFSLQAHLESSDFLSKYSKYEFSNNDDHDYNMEQFLEVTAKLRTKPLSSATKQMLMNGEAYMKILLGHNVEPELLNVANFTGLKNTRQLKINRMLLMIREKSVVSDDRIAEILTFTEAYKEDHVNHHKLKFLIHDFIAPHLYNKANKPLDALVLWAYADHYGSTKSVKISESMVASALLNYTVKTDEFLTMKSRIKRSESNILKWFLHNGIKVMVESQKEGHLEFYKHVRDQNWIKAKNAISSNTTYTKTRNYYSPFIMHYDGYRHPIAIDSTRPFMSLDAYLDLGQKLKNKANGELAKGQDFLNYGMYLFSSSGHGHNSISDDSGLSYHLNTDYNHKVFYYDVTEFEAHAWFTYPFKTFKFTPYRDAFDYYNLYTAEKYLQLAYENLENQEAKAMACFLLARCHQSRAPINDSELVDHGDFTWREWVLIDVDGVEYDSYTYHSLTNPFLKKFKEEFYETTTYKNATTECSYIELFLD